MHRDVTPANLLVSLRRRRQARRLRHRQVAGGGVARADQHRHAEGQDPVYVARAGARAPARSAQRHLFSLGVVAWELLTGAAAVPPPQRARHAARRADVRRAAAAHGAPGAAAGAGGRRRDGARADGATIAGRTRPSSRRRCARGSAAPASRRRSRGWRRRWRACSAATPPSARWRAAHGDRCEADRRSTELGSGATTARPEPRRSPLHPERWIPQIAMHLHLPPPRMPPLRLVGPLLALLLVGGRPPLRLPRAAHARARSARRCCALDERAGRGRPLPLRRPIAPPAPAVPSLKLMPRTTSSWRSRRPASLATAPAQKRSTRGRTHDRQRRKHRAGV